MLVKSTEDRKENKRERKMRIREHRNEKESVNGEMERRNGPVGGIYLVWKIINEFEKIFRQKSDTRNKKSVDRAQTATAHKNRKVKEVILTRKKIDRK